MKKKRTNPYKEANEAFLAEKAREEGIVALEECFKCQESSFWRAKGWFIGRTPFAPKWAPRGFDGHFDAKGRMLLNRPFAGVPDGCAYEWSKADDYLRQVGLSQSAINAVMSELNEKHAELKA